MPNIFFPKVPPKYLFIMIKYETMRENKNKVDIPSRLKPYSVKPPKK